MKYIAYGVNKNEVDEILVDNIRHAAPDYEIITGKTRKELKPYLSKIEIAFRSIESEALAAMPSLKWFQAWSAGVDHLLGSDKISDSNFLISNTSGIHPVPMSEHIFSLLLSLGRGLTWAAAPRSVRIMSSAR